MDHRNKHGGLRIFREAAIFSVLDDTHDLRAGSIGPLEIAAHGTADGAKQFFGELLIDDRHERRIVVIVPGETSAREQRGSGGGEIFRRDVVELGFRGDVGWPKIGGLVGEDGVDVRAIVEGRPIDRSRGLNAGDRYVAGNSFLLKAELGKSEVQDSD